MSDIFNTPLPFKYFKTSSATNNKTTVTIGTKTDENLDRLLRILAITHQNKYRKTNDNKGVARKALYAKKERAAIIMTSPSLTLTLTRHKYSTFLKNMQA